MHWSCTHRLFFLGRCCSQKAKGPSFQIGSEWNSAGFFFK